MDGMDRLAWGTGACRKGPRRRRAILVVGMDRSGTSLVTHVLHRLGAALPHELIGAARGNPLGHWEPRGLVELNREILRGLGRSWDDPRPLPAHWMGSAAARTYVRRIGAEIARAYGDAPLLVIKDPRLCRLLPLYLAALEGMGIEPLVVLQTRPAGEVAMSLLERDGLPPGLSGLLWLRAVTEAEAHSRAGARVWVSYAQMVNDWRGCVDRIASGLRIRWPVAPALVASRIALVVQKGAREVAPSVEEGALVEAWRAVACGLADDEAGAQDGFDRVRAALHEADRYYVPTMSYQIGRLEAELQAMRGSTCWRLTAPLRALRRLAGAPGSAALIAAAHP